MVNEIRNLISDCYQEIDHDAHVTDQMFVLIQSNQNYLNRYRHLCQDNGTETVNRWIGRLIKTMYHLSNSGRAIATSALIRTYTLH